MNDARGILDPALVRGLTSARFGRRDLLGMFGGAAAMGALAGCGGIKPQGKKVDTSVDAVKAYWDKQQSTGELTWANWPLYLDTEGKSDHPSLDAFEKQSGVKVKYLEAVQDNGPFFAKVQPALSSGQYCGFDLTVISSGIYLNKFRDLGFLVPLDHNRLTNFTQNAGKNYQNPPFDPGNTYSIPWQAGFTGIGYNPQATGRPITSWNDLQDPKFKGHVGMFGNNEDLPNAALTAIGVDPIKSTEDDWKKAAAWLQKMKPLVRGYYSQDYISKLATGDIWITMAWSGDIFQQNLSGKKSGEQLKFVMPDEGGLIWTDNFLILKGAKNPVSAMQLMDFYYQPKVGAEVTEWVNYVSPVPEAQQVVEQDAAKAKGADKTYLKKVASSFATFPDQAVYDKARDQLAPKAGEALDTWNGIFEPIFQS